MGIRAASDSRIHHTTATCHRLEIAPSYHIFVMPLLGAGACWLRSAPVPGSVASLRALASSLTRGRAGQPNINQSSSPESNHQRIDQINLRIAHGSLRHSSIISFADLASPSTICFPEGEPNPSEKQIHRSTSLFT